MKTRLVLLPLIAAVLTAMSWAAPAFATSYASRANPIKAGGDGNGAFYGNLTIKQQTSLWNDYWYRDTTPAGKENVHAVYVQTDWYYWVECTGDEYCYDDSGSDQSTRSKSRSWRNEKDSDTLDTNADKGRGITKVCEDQKWSPDPCSKRVIVTLSY